MEKTKKEFALDAILNLRVRWCIHKITDGGCDGCPMVDGGSIDCCALNNLEDAIKTFYKDDLALNTDISLMKEVIK